MWPLPKNGNDSVFSPAVLRLGEAHWYLLKANHVLEDLTLRQVAIEGTTAKKLERTDFGDEVGGDEINWWVFKKDHNVPELRERTARALDAAQGLKLAADKLKGRKYGSYDDLLKGLRELVDAHGTQVDEWYGYASWLYQRDPLAPSILFAYRVWGSTRAGDRTCDVTADNPTAEPSATPKYLAEVVLGLRRGMGLTAWDKAYLETSEDEWARVARSEFEGDLQVDVDEVLARAAWIVADEFSTYTTLVRDSLRNVLLDVDACLQERTLIDSDRFWARFVSKAAASKKAETQLWDFKQTLTMWHAAGAQRDAAKVTFAEDVAAFANARGGVLIVGVTDGQSRQIVGVGQGRDLENRFKFASGIVGSHVLYPRRIATLRQVIVKDGKGVDQSCLLVISAEASDVVGVRGPNGQYTYPVRRDTGIERESPRQIGEAKRYMKSDNHDFLRELAKFVDEN